MILFAFVAGILALATPLAVESLVNVVSWGTYFQPLIVLGLMLLICLGLAGVMKVLQTVVVEMIQRRQFVRIVSDLAHRFPRANRASLLRPVSSGTCQPSVRHHDDSEGDGSPCCSTACRSC